MNTLYTAYNTPSSADLEHLHIFSMPYQMYFCMLCQKAHPTVSLLDCYTQCTLFMAHKYMLQCSITHIAIPLFCATVLVDLKTIIMQIGFE